jgi:hypothetical protein
VESELGEGSRFIFTLPKHFTIVERPGASASEVVRPPEPPGGSV